MRPIRFIAFAALILPAAAMAEMPETIPMHSTPEGCAHLAQTGEMLLESDTEPPVYFDGTTMVFGAENQCTIVQRLPVPGGTADEAALLLFCRDWDLHSPSLATMARGDNAVTLSLDVPPHNLWFQLTQCELPK